MAISQATLRSKAGQYSKDVRTAQDAKALGKKTAFLCHSHKDQELVKGFLKLLVDAGWDIYVDWLDETMPEKPNAVTADKIKRRIWDSSALLFLATQNSMSSKWCPWEIGYGDATKTPAKVFVIPTFDGYTTFGSEYLDLYPRIVPGDDDTLGLFEPGETSGTRIKSVRI